MQGKQVLLTGGTGGLGLGVTPALLSKGAQLTIPYQSESGVERLKTKLSATDFAQIRFVKTDLTQENAVAQLIQDLGRIDALIHLVGGFNMGATEEFSFAAWQQAFQLNLDSTFLVCKYSLQLMRRQGYGRIVTVASKAATQASPRLAAYAASKAGVIALTQAIAAETVGTDITANTILPSVIDTPANREAMGSEQASQWIQPESIASAICFLASEEAKDLRGALLPF